jgi:hypothetical protein
MAERGSVKEVESFKSKSKSERSSKDDLQYLFGLLDNEENEIEEARNGKINNTNALSTRRRIMRIRSALIDLH